ncbi:MAG: MBL fold metallo-hydrolase [Lachnospiraceae bacterium]|nr:MBL fold metallo-hydrolase [Lachnospiraceae bacterium]
MKITALTENTTNKDWPVEHGLSLFIETNRHKILFDSGQSSLFEENAKRAGINLKDVDICILSHGHYDHGGGLRTFMSINDRASVYMNKNAFGYHYHGEERYIGLNRDWLNDDEFCRRIIYTEGVTRIDDELTLNDAKGFKKVIDMGAAGLCVKEDGKFIPEDFRHEHYLSIKENDKNVLISGCSHRGIINIMNWFKPDVLIGGFHFMKHDMDEELTEYAKILDKFDTQYYTCHCTGRDRYEYMLPYMKKLHYLAEGDVIEV